MEPFTYKLPSESEMLDASHEELKIMICEQMEIIKRYEHEFETAFDWIVIDKLTSAEKDLLEDFREKMRQSDRLFEEKQELSFKLLENEKRRDELTAACRIIAPKFQEFQRRHVELKSLT